MLVATAVVLLALVAGGSPASAVLLGIGMLGFQFCIGALNDLSDAERDGSARFDKPIPVGRVSVRAARAIVVVGAGTGLVVSAWFGPAVLLLGVIGLGTGLAYDLAPRRELAGPLAFGLALPTMLMWTWLGAVAMLPPGWPFLLPLAALAGPAVHLANGMADVDRDRGSGATSLATRLGLRRSAFVLVALDVTIWTLAWLGLMLLGPIDGVALFMMASATVVAACAAALSTWTRTASSAGGWMLGAVALAMFALTWGATARS